MEAILVKELSKHFFKSKKKKIGKRGSGSNTIIRAVDAIGFTVNRGEIFGFLGPNGAGKTTTIRMMTGVLKPTKGNIKIFDHDVWKNPIPIKQITGNDPRRPMHIWNLQDGRI